MPNFAGITPQQQEWANLMSGYAEQAQAATGVDARLILAQWGNETAWGTHFAEANNVGNVGVYGGGPNPSYPTLAAGVQAYINNLNSATYANVRNAQGLQAQAVALGNSPWARGHYNNGSGPGSDLLAILGSNVSAAPTTVGTGAASPTANPAITATPGATSSSGGDNASWLNTVLAQYGLSGLASWVQGEVSSGASQDQLMIDLQNTQQFKDAFPGIAIRAANGLPAIDPTTYLSYKDSAIQMARAAGLPPGFLSNTEIGTLIGNDVSTTELSDRITKGYQVAANADPATKAALESYFGVKQGDLAAYYLDPTHALPLLEQQITAAQIGGAGVNSGFGQVGATAATQLAQIGVTQSEARSGFKDIAPLTTLEQALPGVSKGATVTAGQLVGHEFEGTDQEALARAEGGRKAGFEGGGGFQTSAKGVIGAGSASQAGTSGT